MNNPRLVVLIPAYNEASSIGATIQAIMVQERKADQVVVIPNGCTDDTADVARQYPVTVMELPKLKHRKSEALNRAWMEYAQDASYVVCLDADTVLPSNALKDWEIELQDDPALGGSSSKFTMQQKGILPRMQKAEFATWTTTGLKLGKTSVLAGTGCIFNNEALKAVARRDDREAPWSYTSATEDFELTYRIRELGYYCHISPTVRAYTDSMHDLKSLWAQRMKWSVGTQQDLLTFGVNRLTLRDWGQQLMGLLNIFLKTLWLAVIVGYAVLGELTIIWGWLLLPFLFIGLDVKRAMMIPHRDKKDIWLAISFFPNELFMWMRAGWTAWSWIQVFKMKITKKNTDLWAKQAVSEGIA